MRSLQYLLLGSLIFMTALASEARVSIALGERTGAPGESLSIPIDVRTDNLLTALQMDIQYPSSIVDLTAVSEGDWTSDHVLITSPVGNDVQRILVYSPTNAPLPDSVLARLQVNLLNEFPGEIDAVSIDNFRYVMADGSTLQVALSPFVRIVSPTGNISLEERSSLPLESIALETSGAVTRVEFFLNDRRIGIDSSAPYSIAWQVDGQGNAMLVAVAYDADGDSMSSPPVMIDSTGWAFIEAWRQANFTAEQLQDPAINGLFADPEGDAIVNFLEFAFGMDPWAADSEKAPYLQFQEIEGSDFLSLEYRRLADSGPLTYVVETSANMVDWTPVGSGPEEVLIEQLDGVETIRLEGIHPVEGGATDDRFVRVRLEVTD